MQKIIVGLITGLLFFSLFSCNQVDEKMAKVTFSVPSATARNATGTASEILKADLSVTKGSANYYTNEPFVKNGSSWECSITLPESLNLEFLVSAYGTDGNGGDLLLFTGMANASITTNNQIIPVDIYPVPVNSDLLPSVSQISYPERIDSNTVYQVAFLAVGAANETLTYSITADASGGQFTPASGSVTVSSSGHKIFFAEYLSGTGSPSADTRFLNSVTLTNRLGNSVTTEFTMIIGHQQSLNVGVKLSPGINALALTYDGTDVTITASATDDDTITGWNWIADSLQASTSATVTLAAYDISVAHTFELTVTDSGGSATTIDFTLPADFFHPNPVINSAYGFDSDFETGTIPTSFTFGGNANWTIDSTNADGSAYSIRSGVISHSQTSDIMLSFTVPTGMRLTNISFKSAVSCESSDYLFFFVNNSRKLTRSGVYDWMIHSINVNYASGQVMNLRWSYSKDNSINTAQDAVWIDNIVFTFQ